jgi:cytidyltransferase-like protein
MKTIAASGGFDPLHIGHVEYLQHAKSLGANLIKAEDGIVNEARLVVIVNSDDFLVRKKGYAFMPLKERMAIIAALRCVDEVVACIDQDQTVCETLRLIKPDIFAKGGDRNSGNIPELAVCQELGIEIVDGLGQKIQSSSELVSKLRGG